jgi:hypothetical protein
MVTVELRGCDVCAGTLVQWCGGVGVKWLYSLLSADMRKSNKAAALTVSDTPSAAAKRTYWFCEARQRRGRCFADPGVAGAGRYGR